MKLFSIELSARARKSLKKLALRDQELVFALLETLQTNPIPPKALRLRGREGYRIRIGDLRIIYTFDKGKLIILVLDIRHRREINR